MTQMSHSITMALNTSHMTAKAWDTKETLVQFVCSLCIGWLRKADTKHRVSIAAVSETIVSNGVIIEHF